MASSLERLEQLRDELAHVDEQLRDELAHGRRMEQTAKLLRWIAAIICSVLLSRLSKRRRLLVWHLGFVVMMSSFGDPVEAFSRLKSDSRMTCSRLEG